MLIFGRRHLERVLAEYVDHYNEQRPHRALGQLAPLNVEPPPPIGDPELRCLRRKDAVFGLIHEYRIGGLTWPDGILGTHTIAIAVSSPSHRPRRTNSRIQARAR